MRPGRVVLTYRDYAALPNDGRRYEILDGELSVTPAPSPRHQDVLLNLALVFRMHVAARGLGRVFVAPIDVVLSDGTIVQPDIVYVGTDRLGLISERGIEGPPTLVVEILSPTTALIDRTRKMELYARHGVPWYWLVDPDSRAVEIYRLVEGSYALTARVGGGEPLSAEPFPDLVIPPASLWA